MLVLLLALWFPSVIAEPSGLYRPDGGSSRTVDVTRTASGMVFTLVEGRLQTYDGARWQRIRHPEGAVFLALATGADDRVYLGVDGDLGRLEEDEQGQLHFVSLVETTAPDALVGAIQRILPLADGGVLFAERTRLLLWRPATDGAGWVVWDLKSLGYGATQALADTSEGPVIFSAETGLLEIRQGTWHLLPGSEGLAALDVVAVLPMGRALIVVSRRQGLWVYDRGATRPWPSPISELIRQRGVIDAIVYGSPPAMGYAFALENGSIELCDATGEVLGELAMRRTTAPGMRQSLVYGLHEDHFGGLWMASEEGLLHRPPASGLSASGSPTDVGPREVLIRRVRTLEDSDGLLFGGSRDGVLFERSPETLRFEFALPDFETTHDITYQSRLVGLSDTWSAWRPEVYRDFTALDPGHYRFEVRASTATGEATPPTSFAFQIKGQWYRSLWLFGPLAFLILFGLVAALLNAKARQRRERVLVTRWQEADRLKDAFLANTSHELRTPLLGIVGLSEILLGGAAGELPQTARGYLDSISRSGRRLSSLVDGLLDFSQLKHRRSLELIRQPVDLQLVVESVFRLSSPLGGNKDIGLDNAIPKELPPAFADERRLRRILLSLVGDAIKRTELGQVRVSGSAEGGQITVRVSDTGRELDPMVLASGVQEEQSEGHFGLTLSRHLVELHGGKMWISGGDVGFSTTISFTLPVATTTTPAALVSGDTAIEGLRDPAEGADPGSEAEIEADTGGAAEVASAEVSEPTSTEAPRPEVGSEAVAQHPAMFDFHDDPSAENALPTEVPLTTAVGSMSRTPRILVVDDEPINRMTLEGQLQVEGFEVLQAVDGNQTLQILETEEVDLVLLDVVMPDMSGYEVCRRLRIRFSAAELPIIFLTAKNQASDRVAGFESGGNDYLAKPVVRKELAARVRLHLELLHVHRHLDEVVEDRLQEIKVLSGLLPICYNCKKIRNDEGYWSDVEQYIGLHSEAQLSHAICDDCLAREFAELDAKERDKAKESTN